MSVFVCRKYTNALGSRLERFSSKGNDTWSFRCPLCGDSKKSKTKTRGFVYRKKNEFFYRCFNCNVSTTLGSFLKQVAPDLYSQFKFDVFLEKKGVPDKEDHLDKMIEQMKSDNQKLNNLTLSDVTVPLVDLPKNHPAKVYIQNRKIPETSWKYLSFAKDFKEVVLKLDPKRAEAMPHGDPRIVISCLDAEGKLNSVAGRTFDPNNSQRYIHVKVAQTVPKIFGLDRVKSFTGEIFVFEGPIDSMFFENSLATCDADLSFARRFYDNVILVHDNQPRNKDIVRNVGRCIDAGFRVCLFPDHIQFKDINEMILGGMLIEDIRKEILDHTYEGMTAKMNFSRWKKT